MAVTFPPGVEVRPIQELKTYAQNARTHSDEQVAQIVASMKEFGFTNPLLVSEDGEVIAGHGRLLAAEALELGEVPVVVLPHLTTEQRRAYVIADNQLALNAGWDEELLRAELTALDGFGFDLSLVGFSDEQLADLLPDMEELPPEDANPDAVPKPPADPVTKPGDIWVMGKHRVMCGDSTAITDVERLMAGQKADMVFTDPPYNTGMTTKSQSGETKRFSLGKDGGWLGHMFNDSFSDDEWQALLSGMCANYWAATKDSAVLYVCLDWRRSHELVPHLKAHFKFSNLIVWDKIVHGLGSDYQFTHEFIHVCKKGSPEMDTHQGDQEYQDVWHIQRKVGHDDEYATKKPIELVERALRHSSRKQHIVLDLFGGSGSTLIACEKNSRDCRMMELDPTYCDVIVKRWQAFTCKTATLEATGEPFPSAAE